ncbi:MAG: 30S ribosomal protein S6 [Kiritimatiellae bacterium]|jgi:ribosomal protein S6|nr:30S ribosomal protein S6 [Kiritimatiellia bacterium]
MKKYDGLYIFAGSARDEVLDKMIEAATVEITSLSGQILSTEMLGKKTFSRPMKKRDNGVYVKIRFELDPASIAPLVKRYKLVDEVFRVQILAVDERLEAAIVQQAEDVKVREAAKVAAAAEKLQAANAAKAASAEEE